MEIILSQTNVLFIHKIKTKTPKRILDVNRGRVLNLWRLTPYWIARVAPIDACAFTPGGLPIQNATIKQVQTYNQPLRDNSVSTKTFTNKRDNVLVPKHFVQIWRNFINIIRAKVWWWRNNPVCLFWATEPTSIAKSLVWKKRCCPVKDSLNCRN